MYDGWRGHLGCHPGNHGSGQARGDPQPQAGVDEVRVLDDVPVEREDLRPAVPVSEVTGGELRQGVAAGHDDRARAVGRRDAGDEQPPADAQVVAVPDQVGVRSHDSLRLAGIAVVAARKSPYVLVRRYDVQRRHRHRSHGLRRAGPGTHRDCRRGHPGRSDLLRQRHRLRHRGWSDPGKPQPQNGRHGADDQSAHDEPGKVEPRQGHGPVRPLRTFRTHPVDHLDELDHDGDGEHQPGDPAHDRQEPEHEAAVVGHREGVRPVDAGQQADLAPRVQGQGRTDEQRQEAGGGADAGQGAPHRGHGARPGTLRRGVVSCDMVTSWGGEW